MTVVINAAIEDIDDSQTIQYYALICRKGRFNWQVWGSYGSEEWARRAVDCLAKLGPNRDSVDIRILRAVVDCKCIPLDEGQE